MRRGDIVTVALPGAQGKPRPAVIVQEDALTGSESLLVCAFTSDLLFRAPHRPIIEPTSENGLHSPSLVMTDKIQAAPLEKCHKVIGRVTVEQQRLIDAALMFVLGLD
jgi:mRNA interferase MazF